MLSEAFKTKLKGWRTIVWNSLVIISAAGIYFVDELSKLDFTGLFTPKVVSVIIFGLGVAGIFFRIITTSSIGAK